MARSGQTGQNPSPAADTMDGLAGTVPDQPSPTLPPPEHQASVDTADLPLAALDRDATITMHAYGQGDHQRDLGPPQNGYRLGHTIGRGGLAEVKAGIQNSFRRPVALKTLRSDKAHQRAQFYAEARTAALLQHPNILPIYDLIDDDGDVRIVMKQVQGQTWAERIRQDAEARERMTPEYLRTHLAILQDVCQALAYAHDQGILHRDVKPSNVMIGDYGEALLMDWGCAAVYRPREELADLPRVDELRTIVGTPCYLAPEQALIDTGRMGPATDIYLLGACLFEILTGQPPHPGESLHEAIAAARNNRIIPFRPPEERWDWPEELLQLALQALRTDPAERPHNVYAFIAELLAFQVHHEARLLMRMGRTQLDLAKRDPVNAGEHLRKAIGFAEEAAGKWPEQSACHDLLFTTWLAASKHAMEAKDFSSADLQAQTACELAKTPGQKFLARRVQTDAVKQQTQTIHRHRMVGTMRTTIRWLSIALVLLLGLMVVAMLIWVLQNKSQETDVRQQRQEKDTYYQLMLWENYAGNLHRAAEALERGAFDEAQTELDRCSLEKRAWAWGHLQARVNDEAAAMQHLDIGRYALIAWHPTLERLLIGQQGGRLSVWTPASPSLGSLGYGVDISGIAHLASSWPLLTCMAWLPGDLGVLVGTGDGMVIHLNEMGGEVTRAMIGREKPIIAILPLGDGGSFICGIGSSRDLGGDGSGEVCHVDLTDLHPIAGPVVTSQPVTALALDRENRLVVGTEAGLQVMNGTDLSAYLVHADDTAGGVRDLAIDQSRTFLAIARGRQRLVVADLDAQMEPRIACILHGHPGITAVAWSPMGGLVASGGSDGTVRIWGTQLLGELLILDDQQSGAIRDLVFSADGSHLAVVDDAGHLTIRSSVPITPGSLP